MRSAFDLHGGHPSATARQSLAIQLGMTPKSVQVWFQNRRQKLRAMEPRLEGTRAVSGVLLGGGHMHLNNLLGDGPSACKGTFAANPKFDRPATSSTRPPSAEVARSPASIDAAPSISSALSPALLASLTALAGKGNMRSNDALRSRATLASVPRHLVTELARLTTAENELVLLASHLSKRKAQLVASIAQHAATAGLALGKPLWGVTPMEDDVDPSACTLPPLHPSPPPGSWSPLFSSHPSSPEESHHPAHGQYEIESPMPEASHPPSPTHEPGLALEARAACASAVGLSGLYLLSSMATHITAAAPMAISAA